MKGNSTFLVLSLVFFLGYGAAQIVRAFAYEVPRQDRKTRAFVEQYLPRDAKSAAMALFQAGLAQRTKVASLAVSYHAVTGGLSAIIGLLVLSVLLQQRRGRKVLGGCGAPAPSPRAGADAVSGHTT